MSRVSIIVPLFNKADYIRETLESVISQSHDDWECLVIDNGSSDESVANAKAVKDSRIQLMSFTESQGPGATRNFGLARATGEWVLFLDADDIITKNHLADLLAVAGHNPDAMIVAGNWLEKNSEFSDCGTEKFVPDFDSVQDSLIASAPWAIHAAIIKREATPHWPIELDGLLGEDIAFWFRAARGQELVLSESAGAIYRTGTENCRSKYDDVGAWYAGVDGAIQNNVENAREISPNECDHLIRVYQGLFTVAKNANDKGVAKVTLTKAEFWLKQRVGMMTPLPRNIRFRKWFGVRAYAFLKHWFAKSARCV